LEKVTFLFFKAWLLLLGFVGYFGIVVVVLLLLLGSGGGSGGSGMFIVEVLTPNRKSNSFNHTK
jgi:Trk-type K+ transport system membrane component